MDTESQFESELNTKKRSLGNIILHKYPHIRYNISVVGTFPVFIVRCENVFLLENIRYKMIFYLHI